jgi:hypothetical protein
MSNDVSTQSNGLFVERKRKVRKLDRVVLVNPPTVLEPLRPHVEPLPEPEEDPDIQRLIAETEEAIRLERLHREQDEWLRKVQARQLLNKLLSQTQIK